MTMQVTNGEEIPSDVDFENAQAPSELDPSPAEVDQDMMQRAIIDLTAKVQTLESEIKRICATLKI